MKRLYIAICFLVIAIGLCTFEQYTVKSTYEQTTKYIDKATKEFENSDYENLQNTCLEFSKYWNKKYIYMSSMCDHNMLDEASVTINSLPELAKNKNDELENELIVAKNQTKSIYDNQRITFNNIF